MPVGILAAALTGSLHCTFMCGPLVHAVAPRPKDWIAYQFGRTLSYVALGALAGGLSAELQSRWGEVQVFQRIYMSGLGALLITWGILQWQGRSLPIPRFIRAGKKLNALLFAKSMRPLTVGLGSALLPCGYLHGFLLGAFASQSAMRGAGVMAMLALGSAPGLFGFSAFLRSGLSLGRWIPGLPLEPRKISALFLILSGIWSVAQFGGWLHGGHSHAGHSQSTESHHSMHHH